MSFARLSTLVLGLTLSSPLALAQKAAPEDVKSTEAPSLAAAVVDTKPDADAPAVAEAPKKPEPPAVTLVAKVDLSAQKVTILEHGKAIYTWSISSGTREHATPTGQFKPGWMAKMWYSKQYDNAPMPHAVFFNGGIAMHATQSVGNLGRPASHGCIRLSPTNAATFYGLVSKHRLVSTRVHVFGWPKFREPAVASRGNPYRSGGQYASVAYRPSAPMAYGSAAPSGYMPVAYNGGYSNSNSYFLQKAPVVQSQPVSRAVSAQKSATRVR